MAVTVVSYNARDDLVACLRSIRQSSNPAPPITVVDNGSSDGSPALVRAEFPEVDVVIDPANRGYGAAANLGARRSDAPYLFVLNSDTMLALGAVDALSDYLDTHPRVAIAGPRLRSPDGTLEPSCHAPLGTFRSVLEKSRLGRAVARLPGAEQFTPLNGSHDRPRSVPWITGAALAIRRTAFDAVGGFDEGYFMYAEEVDLCWRVERLGWEVHFAPVTDITHRGGASTAPLKGPMALQKVRSAIRFYRQHYAPPRAALLVLGIRAAMLLRWGRDMLRLQFTGDARHRARLTEDLALWRRAARRPDADPFGAGRPPHA